MRVIDPYRPPEIHCRLPNMTSPIPRLRVSPSQLATFRQCQLKWRLAYLDGWRAPEKAQGSAAGVGTLWSTVMETLYTEGHRQADAWIRDADVSTDLRDQLTWMLDGYIEYYRGDPHWTVLAVEQELVVPLRTPEGEDAGADLLVKPDLLIKDRDLGVVLVVDHKTVDAKPQQRHLDIDDQFGLYMLAHQYSTEGTVPLFPRHAMYNGAIRKRLKRDQQLHERYYRNISTRTSRELKIIEADAVATVRAMEAVRDGVLVPYPAPDHKTCTWKCDFLEAHLVQRKAGEALMADYLAASGFTKREEN